MESQGRTGSQPSAVSEEMRRKVDAAVREFGYLPRLDFHLTIEAAGDAAAERAIRWRVRGLRAKNGEVEDVSLVPVTRFRWF